MNAIRLILAILTLPWRAVVALCEALCEALAYGPCGMPEEPDEDERIDRELRRKGHPK